MVLYKKEEDKSDKWGGSDVSLDINYAKLIWHTIGVVTRIKWTTKGT